MQYQLTIEIDPEGLQRITELGQCVTLVKRILPDPPFYGSLPIAWLTLAAPTEISVITWTENYSVYASTTPVQPGATISMPFQTPSAAQPGFTYTLENGVFSPTRGIGTTFGAANEQGRALAFGLAQAATVNDAPTFAPLNAVPVRNSGHVSFTPIEAISIFLSNPNYGTVLSEVPPNALIMSLSSVAPAATIGFDDAGGTFYVASMTGAS
jgi:hypothetical protein